MTFSSPPQGSKRLAEAIAAAEAVNAMGIAQGDDKQQQPSSGTGTAGGPVPQAHQTAVPLSLSGIDYCRLLVASFPDPCPACSTEKQCY